MVDHDNFHAMSLHENCLIFNGLVIHNFFINAGEPSKPYTECKHYFLN